MKKSEYLEKLAKYLVKRDRYLALNIYQARNLTKLVAKFNKNVDMAPPELPGVYHDGKILKREWEDEEK